ncbi:amino acid ABC transporter ATP-binding protein [Cellulosilyticum ruminicola]|uniref:amino acid ABC transporter ATP-binding protein n=1 Tax=Cellulosilyticum ruminicola TaxID=425254 RepID=UPI0006D03040|nr:amino acid ABC transporter ATP-binding protein [Cellulosilyticum ruminicola]
MLKVEGLYKSYGKTQVLKGANLHVKPGEVVVVVGASGGGKTTFLRSVNYLEKCQTGSIQIGGKYLLKDGVYASKEEIREIRRNIGLVFQGFNLFPHKNVLENLIEAPIRVLKYSPERAKDEAMQILTFLNLADKADSYPCELSGGQKQRVAIGRALALKPELMCFDEPTSALDPALTGEVAKVIKSLSGEGMAMLIITHDMQFAKQVADRIVSMEDGCIVEEHIYANAD